MPNVPKRHFLVSQSVAYLKAQIATGEWRDWLLPERQLVDVMQVSRSTLRLALEQLRKDKIIKSRQGFGNEIISHTRPAKALPVARDVGLLAFLPPERMMPKTLFWIDEFRSMLAERGYRLHFVHGRQYFGADPDSALRRLVAAHRHGCWILTMCNGRIQRWFDKSKIPTFVSGSTYPGVNLPFLDLDHRAICRHAAGVMLRNGHTRLAILTPKWASMEGAGDQHSVAGFLEGCESSHRGKINPLVAYHGNTVADVSRVVREIFERKDRPTALLVMHSHHFLTVVGILLELGLRVPRDVSLIARDDDPSLQFFVPELARYAFRSRRHAKRVFSRVMELLETGVVIQRSGFYVPEFVAGASICRRQP